MKLKHIALIGSLFPILFSLVLFFGVLISADSDDENSNFSSGITGMNLSAEVLKHQHIDILGNTVFSGVFFYHRLMFHDFCG